MRDPNLEAMLLTVFVPDTAQIKQAEAAIKQYCKNPQCVPALLEEVVGSTHVPVRQLAASLLRRRVVAHWAALDCDPAVQQGIQQALLQAMLAETVSACRTAIAGVIASLATILLTTKKGRGAKKKAATSGKGWPELLPFVGQCAASQDPAHREMAFVILLQLTEVVGDKLGPHFGELKQMFFTVLTGDASPSVQRACLRCCATLMAYLSEDQQGLTFKDLIPPVLAVAQRFLLAAAQADQPGGDQSMGDREACLSVVMLTLDVLADLTASPLSLINTYIQETVSFCRGVLEWEGLDLHVRDSAALVLSTLAEAKPRQLAKRADVPALLLALTNLIATSKGSAAGELFASDPIFQDDDAEDSDADEDELSPQKIASGVCGMAQTCLDSLALNLPMKHVFKPAMQIFGQLMVSPDPGNRKAAACLLAVIAEGCQIPLSESLAEVVPLVLRGVSDQNCPLVREAGCFCLGQLSEHCQPEIFQFHAQILPCVFVNLDDPTHTVQGMSCYVLEMFCENMEPDMLMPYLDPLMTKLVGMLRVEGQRRSIQEMVLSAIAATSVGAEDKFLPYLQGVCALLQTLLFASEENLLGLRGRALECMGHFAVAVKKDHFAPYIQHCMESASQNLQMDNTDLHEYSYAFFSNLVRVLEGDFGPYLPQLVPFLCEQLSQSDGCDVELGKASGMGDDEDGLAARFDDDDEDEDEGGVALGGGDDDDEDDDSELGNYVLSVRTAELDRRKAAIAALGAMASHAGPSFQPFLEVCMQTLERQLDYWNGMVRLETAVALPQLVKACNSAHPPPATPQTQAAAAVATQSGGSAQPVVWIKGQPQSCPLHQNTHQLAYICLQHLLKLIEREDEKEVTAGAVSGIDQILTFLGPAVLNPPPGADEQVTDPLMNHALKLLQGKSVCQEADDEGAPEDVEEDAEGSDMDHALLDNTADLLGTISSVMGDAFIPFWDGGFLNAILEFSRSTRPAKDRSMAVGCVADVMQHFDCPLDKYLGVVVPVCKLALADEAYNVRRNSAFLAGVLCAGCPPTGALNAGECQALLAALRPLFEPSQPGQDGAARDNAAAALARMITHHPGSVPFAQVLPVFLGSLPLQADQSENDTVYDCLLSLLQARQPDLLNLLPSLLGVFAQALHENSKVDACMKTKLAGAVKAIFVEMEVPATAALESLPAEAKDFILQLKSSQ
eukprot:CAMPEP_0113942732 /NCGR_PEP_ID=MMETSP1339-20121228/8362_1 /TAXON_ID=94617 /ORGANISM="Fibrocapsa japonica" /LENGTH=1186 /DNA_ID=CAMNT_0000947279 /DNA_START=128 /DNA_END=3688 /DNA_ORIENTATION=- /assembly_acc=CAM_ASM_000762